MRYFRLSLILMLLPGYVLSGCSLFYSGYQTGEQPYKYPSLARAEISLAGPFRFTIDPEETGLLKSYHLPGFNDSSWIQMQDPGSPESRRIVDEMIKKTGRPSTAGMDAWYRKWILVPSDWEKRDLEIDAGQFDESRTFFWNGFNPGETKDSIRGKGNIIPRSIVKCGEKNILAVCIRMQPGGGGMIAGPISLRPIMPWDHLSLRVESPSGLFLFSPNSPVRLDLLFENPMNLLLPVTANITGRDFDEVVVYRESFPLLLNRHKTTILTLEMPPYAKGHYDFQIDLYGNDLPLKRFKTSFAVIEPLPGFEKLHTSPFGVCGGDLFQPGLDDQLTAGQNLVQDQAQLGAFWGRYEFTRGQIEPEQGRRDFASADSAVKMYQEHKIQLAGVLDYSTDWMKGAAPQTEEEYASFGRYVEEVTGRYASQILHWEIGNAGRRPFRLPKPGAGELVQTLKTAHTAIKKIAPEKQVIGLGANPDDLSLIEESLKMGAGEFMDIISIHACESAAPADTDITDKLSGIRRLNSLLETHHCAKPIWITECGLQTQGNVKEQDQAVHLVKFHVSVLAEGLVEKIFWYNMTDSAERDSPEWGHFGLVHKDQTPKPSYVAYHTMLAHLHDFISVKRPELPGGVIGFDFTFKDRHKTRVLWTGKTPRMIPTPEKARVRDLMGNEIDSTEGRIMLDSTPRYIVGEWE